MLTIRPRPVVVGGSPTEGRVGLVSQVGRVYRRSGPIENVSSFFLGH